MLMRLTSAALPAPITATGSGSFNTVAHAGTFGLTMDFSAIPQVAQALGTSTIRIDEIIDGQTFYVKLPAALNRNPALGGKPWLEINLGNAANALGSSEISSLFNNPAASNPSQFLSFLRATSGNVHKVGTQTVDGHQTTEYQAQIDLKRLSKALAIRFPKRKILNGESVLPITVWIDQQHLVRRMQFALKQTVSGQPLSANVQIDIPQYGPQPTPQLPPVSDVANLTGAAGAGTSSGG